MTRQQETIKAIQAAGGVIVPAKTTRYVRVDFNGCRYWVGKMGGLREGLSVARSRSLERLIVQGVVIATGFGSRHGIGEWDG